MAQEGEHGVRGGQRAHVGCRSRAGRCGECVGGAARVGGPVVLRDDDEQPVRGVVVPEVGVVRGAQRGAPVTGRGPGHGQPLAGHRALQFDRFGCAAGADAGEADVPRARVDRQGVSRGRHGRPRFLNRPGCHQGERSSGYAEAGG